MELSEYVVVWLSVCLEVKKVITNS